MTDRPIIFSGPMVRALLDGRKTMTRRLAWQSYRTQKLQPLSAYATRASPWQSVEPGDRLWVREMWTHVNAIGAPAQPRDVPKSVLYAADPRGAGLYKWRPSIHMPRWASRITLEVTATKLERVQEISANDAYWEGTGYIDRDGIDHHAGGHPSYSRFAFSKLWCSLHGPGSWEANPEVVALTFTVHQCNIDSMEAAA